MSYMQKRSKQTKSLQSHNGKLKLFLAGCALGAVCFLWVYGARILNPVYDAWLFNTDIDLKQHYIGFCHYRMSDWLFPLGLIDTLSYPTSMSVIYTDSIPLFALVFKLFRNFLPVHFQYFGMFGLMSFMLMGGLSSVLIFSFIDGTGKLFSEDSDGRIPFINTNLPYVLSLIASAVYILSFTVLQRMFYHTALSAQWIIILALYIWMERRTYSRKKTLIIYSFMGLLCVGIHTYYVPMVGSILLAASVEKIVLLIRRKRPDSINNKNETVKDNEGDTPDIKSIVIQEIVNLLGFCATGLLTLFVFGAFNGPSGGYGEGLGSFTSNLNTFINPVYGSIIIKPMKLYYDFQYEGYGYLGIGVFMLTVAVIVYLVKNIRTVGVKMYFKSHIRAVIFLALLAVDFMLAVLPMVTFGEKKLFGVPLPSFIRNAAGIFRSNGRFIWVPVYLIYTGCIVCAIRMFSQRFSKLAKGKGIVLKILLVAVLFQVLDTTKVVSDKQAYFKAEQKHTNVWESLKAPKLSDGYDEFVFLYNENDIIMDTAFYAYLNGMKLNNFYYARDIDDTVDLNISNWRDELKAGTFKDGVVYICKKDDPIIDEVTGVKWIDLDEGHCVGTK